MKCNETDVVEDELTLTSIELVLLSLSHIFKNNIKTHFISQLFCHQSYQVHISNGSSFGQWELATYLVAMVTLLQWQPKRHLYNSLILIPVEFILNIVMF